MFPSFIWILFVFPLEGIKIEKWDQVDIHSDTPDNKKTLRRRSRKYMPMMRSTKSAIIGSVGARLFSGYNSSWNVIWFCEKKDKDIPVDHTIKNGRAETGTRDCFDQSFVWKYLFARWETNKK